MEKRTIALNGNTGGRLEKNTCNGVESPSELVKSKKYGLFQLNFDSQPFVSCRRRKHSKRVIAKYKQSNN